MFGSQMVAGSQQMAAEVEAPDELDIIFEEKED
jgi:hypothetical protein